jgi:VWFA-related protein
VLAAVAGGALAAAFARAGEAPELPEFGERLEVRIVQVDLWAEADGRPVLDLGPGELKLTEDGQPVEILYFASPPVAAPPAAPPAAPGGADEQPAAPPALSEPALVAILLDEPHLGLGARARTLAALRDWLAGDRLGRDADLLLVAHERELRVVAGRTRERGRLLEALERLAAPSTVAVELGTAERRTLDAIRDHQRNAIEQQRDMPQGAARQGASPEREAIQAQDDATLYFEPPCSARLLRYADEHADRVSAEAEATLAALAALADALAAQRGRKLLLFASEGPPSRPGGAAYDFVRTLCDGSGARAGIQYAIDVGAQAEGGALRGQLSASALALAGEDRSLAGRLDEVVARANSSGVSIWTLGASGLTASGSGAAEEARTTTPEAQARRRAEAEDLLHALAAGTGGRALLESNRFELALGALAGDLVHAYSLAFASRRAGDGRVHRIALETTRPGVRLRYRRSWRDASSEEELAGLVGGALRYGIDRPGLGAEASLGRVRAPDGALRLVLRLALPPAALAVERDERGRGRGRVRVAIALRPAGGQATPVRTRTVPVEAPGGEAGGSEPLVHDIGLPELAPGSIVAVGVRDELSGDVGIFRLEVGGT